MRKAKESQRTCEVPTKANVLVPSLRSDAKNDKIVQALLSCYDYVVIDRAARYCGFDSEDRSQCRRGVLVTAIKRD